MNNNHRELTGREKQQVRKLVTSHCANYDREYGCLPLDCDCPMLHICYTNSAPPPVVVTISQPRQCER